MTPGELAGGSGWLGTMTAMLPRDDNCWDAILARQLQLARDAGALGHLPTYLATAGMIAGWSGDFGAAASLIAEVDAVCEATGVRYPPFAALLVAGLRGNRDEAVPLIDATISAAEAGGQGTAVTYARWAAAVLDNGLGRYEEAREAARQATEDPFGLHVSLWALPELIEAAARCGNTRTAHDAVARRAETAQAGGTDWGLGIQARSRALVAAGAAAEGWYQEAIDRLGRTRLRPELARARLLYGEWLRRQGRRAQAREQLRAACQMLDEIGMAGFAERARRELAATGETSRKRAAPAPAGGSEALTAQEVQVAWLAREGLHQARHHLPHPAPPGAAQRPGH